MSRLAKRITHGSKKSFGMFEKASVLAGRGADLIHLEVGRPSHDTPRAIVDATIAALEAGHHHYGDMRGLAPLREAFAAKLRAFNGIDVTPKQVLVTNGLTHGAFAAIMATIDPGDEVIVLEPYYPQHNGKIELAGGKVVSAPLDAENGFSIRADLIEAKITQATRAIVLINPCNPTGRVFSDDELSIIANIAIKHDLLVVADEVYEYITFGRPHVSIASLPGMAERTISLFAFTKAYAMDGWRLGCAVGPAAIIEAMMKITMNDVTQVNTFIQYGALDAVVHGAAVLEEMVAEDRRKRDLVVQRLNQMPGVACREPEGTIYAFADVSGLKMPSQVLAERILEEAHVVVEAGSFYGAAGDGYLRICFGSESEERLTEAMDRLSRFFNKVEL